ncbi:MAG TPA: site-specific integrase, partial [Gaiellaceae bacterium]|nr:site-specific integrase [Gaiellaceae bacterium]
YAPEWLATYTGRTVRGLREQTREDYGGFLERDAIPFFGRRRLAEIEPRDVKRFVAELGARGLAPASVRKSLAPVRALFATAVEEGLIRSNPAAGIRVARALDVDAAGQEQPAVKALTEDELRALLAELDGQWRLFVEFLAHTGLRIGEAIALQWRHVDLGRGRVLVRRRFYRGSFAPPKSRYGRRDVPLSEGMARALWDLRKRRPTSDDALVFTSATGRMVDPSNAMTRVLKPAAVEAGLGAWVKDEKARGGRRAETFVGWHTLRHTAATTLFRAGLNAKQVQVWLGHHSPAFTLERYVHLLPDDLPDPAFLDAVTATAGGNTAATSPAETGRDAAALSVPETRMVPDVERHAEAVAGSS